MSDESCYTSNEIPNYPLGNAVFPLRDTIRLEISLHTKDSKVSNISIVLVPTLSKWCLLLYGAEKYLCNVQVKDVYITKATMWPRQQGCLYKTYLHATENKCLSSAKVSMPQTVQKTKMSVRHQHLPATDGEGLLTHPENICRRRNGSCTNFGALEMMTTPSVLNHSLKSTACARAHDGEKSSGDMSASCQRRADIMVSTLC